METGEVRPLRWWDPVRLARRSIFPALLQVAAFGFYLYLILAGWGRHGIPGKEIEGPLLYTNLATLGFWVVWFMALVLLLPLVGRLWCTICPVGGCNDLVARVGAGKIYPRRLQNFALMALLLLVLSLTSELFSFNRYPDYTAYLLLGVLAASVLAGLIFKGRVFCRFWCPIGGMAGLYTRMAPVEVGSRDYEVCRRCESKACYTGRLHWYRLAWSGWHSIFPFRRPGCPAYIFPPEAASSDNCLMCTLCFKNCPHDNLRWGSRPFFSGLWTTKTQERGQAFLVIVLLGVASYRLIRFWSDLRVVIDWPASALAASLPFINAKAFAGLKLLAGFAFWPLAYFLACALLAKVASEISLTSWPADGEKTAGLLFDMAEIDEKRRREEQGWEARKHTLLGYLTVFAPAYIPLIAGVYGAFALVKLNEKLGYLPLVLRDPAGVRTYLAISDLQILSSPESLVPLGWVRWGAVLLVAGGTALALWSVRRIGENAYGKGSPPAGRGVFVFRIGIVLLGAMMLTCLRIWLFRG